MTDRLSLKARVERADGAQTFIVHGRLAWALSELVRAGKAGCTPLTHPGPRWSAYVHRLRHDFGLDIETIPEPHNGPFAGWHGRYVLREQVELLQEREAA